MKPADAVDAALQLGVRTTTLRRRGDANPACVLAARREGCQQKPCSEWVLAVSDRSASNPVPVKPTLDVTIVIPSYNRPKQLEACLARLAELDGGPYPTIVVDDGSPTPMEPVCKAAGDWVTCLRQENAGPGLARNAGVAAATTTLICFIDDDCYARPDWVRQLVAAHAGAAGRVVGGRIVNQLTSNAFSSASQSLCSYLYDYYQSHGSEMTFFTTNNMCFRREDFLQVGGFSADFPVASEDRDLSLRWKAWGGSLVYCEQATVEHAHRLNLRSFWKQHANYGRGARDLHRAMDDRADPRPKLESVRFYTGMLLYPLRRPGKWRLAQSFLIGLSQVAMVWGYLRALRRERRDAGSGPRATASTGSAS